MKSTITEIKILLERFKSRFDQAEERINESVDKSIKFIKSEEEKEKKDEEQKRKKEKCEGKRRVAG